MSEQTWAAVDDYYTGRLLDHDPALAGAQAAGEAAGLPPIAVTPVLGRMLNLMAAAIGAHRILEVGTLGGYSTIWLARALPPDGRLITLELEPRHAEVARENLERAGCSGVVEVRVGAALGLLAALAEEVPEPFDLVFIDADKPNNARYFEWAVRLARPGALIVVDNVVRGGAVLRTDPAAGDDPAVIGARTLADTVGADRRVEATVVQTVGAKGHDGFLLARVR